MSDEKTATNKFKRHAIQLVNISVRELSIYSHNPPDAKINIDGGSFNFTVSHSDYDTESKVVGVALRVEIGREFCGKDFPFELKVEIVGEFSVNEDEFPIEHIEHFASHNAPLLIYPYIREHAFALTARCGYNPIILPLFELPVFTIESKKNE